jgi:hypothetical protein
MGFPRFPAISFGAITSPPIRVMITDGHSQEFNAVDESIFVFFTRAVWIRCAFCLVEMIYEKDGPFHRDYLDSLRAYSLVTAIKMLGLIMDERRLMSHRR